MKTTFNFETEIASSLLNLENQRLQLHAQLKHNYIYRAALPALAILALIFYFLNPAENTIPEVESAWALFFGISIVVAIAAFVICLYIYQAELKKYRIIYKDILVKPLMSKLLPELTYAPHKVIAKELFNQSKLYSTNYYAYRGDDYFEGNVNGVPIKFSELQVVRNNKSNSNGENVLFSGLFFHAGLEKSISEQLIISPIIFKPEMNVPAFIVNMVGKLLPNYGETLKTGYEKFDREFNVHCTSAEAIRNILTTDLMNKILEINALVLQFSDEKKQLKDFQKMYMPACIKLSVTGNSLFMAIERATLFNIKFSKPANFSKTEIANSISYIQELSELATMLQTKIPNQL